MKLLLLLSISWSHFTVNVMNAGQFKEFDAVNYDVSGATITFNDFACYGAIPNKNYETDAKGGFAFLMMYTPRSGNMFALQNIFYYPDSKTFLIIPSHPSIWCEQITIFKNGFE